MAKKRILIVDDEKGFTDLVKTTLEGTGKYSVHTENDGGNGFAAARSSSPDLILLDLMMPGVDGSKVADRLNNDPKLKKIPVIFLTAAVTPEEATSQEGVIGGRLFMAKPVVLKELIENVNNNVR